MKKVNRILGFLTVALILLIGLLSLSTISKLLVAVFFPPILTVGGFLLLVSLIDLDKKQAKTVQFIFAVYIIGVALFSTGAGFHYASNEINEVFEPYNLNANQTSTKINIDNLIFTKEKLFYLDEIYSHWLIVGGVVFMVLTGYAWWYYFVKKSLPEVNPKGEDEINFFFPIFGGTMVGAVWAFGVIESNLAFYTFLLSLIIVPFGIYKSRKKKSYYPKKIKALNLFVFAVLGALVGVLLAYLITINAFPSIR